MTFNPNKRTAIERSKLDRAMFWYEVRLYIKVALIVGIPFSLALWAILDWMHRN